MFLYWISHILITRVYIVSFQTNIVKYQDIDLTIQEKLQEHC